MLNYLLSVCTSKSHGRGREGEDIFDGASLGGYDN